MKRHFVEHGYTEGCEGCGRMSAGMKSRPHTDGCRKRMYQELQKTEEGRDWMREADARIHEYLAEKVREDHEEQDEADRKERKDRSAEAGGGDAAGPGAADARGPVEPLFDGSEARVPDTDEDGEEKEKRTKRKGE